MLLDDATRLATAAAAADVPVVLEVTSEVPHVFQASPPCSTGDAALDSAAGFLRAHLAATELGATR